MSIDRAGVSWSGSAAVAGDWARTRGLPLKAMLTARETLEPDRSWPSSHLITGIVLRALAAHRHYRHSAATRHASELLKSRFFCCDTYPDRAAPSYWLIFSYPYWWTDLLSALDTLAQIGFHTSRLPHQRSRHRPRRRLVHCQPGAERLVEHRPQPAQEPLQRPMGRPGHLPDAQHGLGR
jgi:hypothetical protein